MKQQKQARRAAVAVVQAMGAAALISAFGAKPATAAIYSWDNGGADGLFATATNWNPNTTPGAIGTTDNVDIIQFLSTSGPAQTITIDAGRNIKEISFDNAVAVNSFTFAGGPLVLSAAGVIASANTKTETFDNDIILSGNATFQGTGTNSLVFNGDISANSGTAVILSINAQVSGQRSTINGNISDGTNAGTVIGLSKSGTGSNGATWVLTGNNSFSGNISVIRGAIVLGSSGALPSGMGKGNLQLDSGTSATNRGGVLDLNGFNAFVNGLVADQETVAANGAGTIVNDSGSGTATITVGLNNAASSFSGQIKNNNTGSGVVAVTKTGTGIWTVNGNSAIGANLYTGDTTINGGAINLAFSAGAAPASNILSASTALVLGGGQLTVTGKSATAVSQTVNGLTVNSGAGAIVTTVPSGGSTNVTVGSIARTSAGGTLLLGTPAGATVTTSSTNTSAAIMNGWTVVTGATATNPDWANVSAGNILAFTAYDDDLFTAGANSRVTASTAVNLTDATLNSLKFVGTTSAGGSTLNDTGTLTISSGGILASNIRSANGDNSYTIAGGSLTSGNGSDLIVYNVDQNTSRLATVQIDSIIKDNGATPIALTKSGSGTLILTNSNTYTGATYLNGGVLSFTSNANLGSVATGAAVNLNGGTLRLASGAAALDDDGIKRNISLGGNGGTIDVAGLLLVVSGVVSGPQGSGFLTKSGNGALALTGANTYAGGTVLSAGALGLGHDSALGTGAIAMTGSSTLQSTDGTTRNIANQLGTFAGSSAVYTFGATSGGTGNLNFTNPNWASLGSSAARTFQVHTQTSFAGGFAGTGTSLTKTGAGTLIMGGNSSYTGGTNVQAGTLLANGASATGTGAVNVTGGTLGGSGSIAGSVTVAGGAALRGGSGSTGTTLTLGGQLDLLDSSVLVLNLDNGGVHSTLARTGAGNWTFDSDQAFFFETPGNLVAGSYDNIITGLAADPGTLASWTILNGGWAGSFSYDGANVDLNLTTVPEPAALTPLLAGIGMLIRRRQRMTK